MPIAADAPEPRPDVSAVAAHFADRSRSRMLLELLDGASRPASHLARIAGISASTASEHLSRLEAAGLIVGERSGRTRRLRLADDRVALVLETLALLAPAPEPRSLRASIRWERLRVARSCYDHLAGSLGTDVLAGLVDTGALVRTDGIAGTGPGADDEPSRQVAQAPYALGPAAEAMLVEDLGIDLAALQAASRPLLRACMDWTEQRHHLAGGLGAAVMRAVEERGWIERRPGRRDLRVARPEEIAGWLRIAS